MKNEGIKVGELIEKYRFGIGSFLILAILVGSGVLVWREAKEKPHNELDIAGNKRAIESLENRLVGVENKIDELPGNQTTQTSNPINESSTSGEVAGVTTNSDSSNYVSGKVNLNTSSASQLDTLPGIGPAYAGRIIDYREINGGFKNISEIQNVKGIGPKTFEKLKDLITVD